jgi:hypothetical protein
VTRPDVLVPGETDPDRPEWWQRALRLRRVPIVAAIILGVIVVKAMSGATGPPPLTTSCTTPAFALSTYTITGHRTVEWSATGPGGQAFAIGIGVDHYTPAPDGHLAPVPDPGVGPRDTRTTAPQHMGKDCTAHGLFGVVMPVGTYNVRLFTIEGNGTDATVTAVATKTLKVTAG